MAIQPRRPGRRSTPPPESPGFTSSPLYWFLLLSLLVVAGFLLHSRLNESAVPAPLVDTPPPETPKVIPKEETKVIVADQTPPPPPPTPVVMNDPPKPMKPAAEVKEEALKYNRFYKTVSTRLVKAHVGDPARLDEDDITCGVALLGQECGPQSAEATADDEQIARDIGCEREGLVGSCWAIEPENSGAQTDKRLLSGAARSSREEHEEPFEVGGVMKPEPALRRPTNPFETSSLR